MFDLESFANELSTLRIHAYSEGEDAYKGDLIAEIETLRDVIQQHARRGGSRYRVLRGHASARAIEVYCGMNNIDHIKVDTNGDVWLVWHRNDTIITDDLPALIVQK